MKTLKILALLFTIFLFSGCQKKNYFDFDEVDYYFKNVSEDEMYKVSIKENKTISEKEFQEVVQGNSPERIQSEFSKSLVKFGYKKTIIDKAKNEQLNNIFSENNCQEGSVAACIPVYRDIFIFKKNNKVIGIAKICFDCRLFHIIGTNKSLENFGQCGDFEKLEKLVR